MNKTIVSLNNESIFETSKFKFNITKENNDKVWKLFFNEEISNVFIHTFPNIEVDVLIHVDDFTFSGKGLIVNNFQINGSGELKKL